jgi:putative endonuclease
VILRRARLFWAERFVIVKQPCVYILASKRNGTLYIGMTSDLFMRIGLHKQDLIAGFTRRYGVHRLVYYETHDSMPEAIAREKRLKKWNRAWKIRLIESMNPEWNDLFDEFWGVVNDGPADQSRCARSRPDVER